MLPKVKIMTLLAFLIRIAMRSWHLFLINPDLKYSEGIFCCTVFYFTAGDSASVLLVRQPVNIRPMKMLLRLGAFSRLYIPGYLTGERS